MRKEIRWSAHYENYPRTSIATHQETRNRTHYPKGYGKRLSSCMDLLTLRQFHYLFALRRLTSICYDLFFSGKFRRTDNIQFQIFGTTTEVIIDISNLYLMLTWKTSCEQFCFLRYCRFIKNKKSPYMIRIFRSDKTNIQLIIVTA